MVQLWSYHIWSNHGELRLKHGTMVSFVLELVAGDTGSKEKHRSMFITLLGCIECMVVEWLACRTQARKSTGSNRSRDAVE